MKKLLLLLLYCAPFFLFVIITIGFLMDSILVFPIMLGGAFFMGLIHLLITGEDPFKKDNKEDNY